MKILIVSQYFYPEEFKINDLARDLVARGHQVSVLTGKPNYPKGEYYEGYQYSGVQKEDYYGVEIIRVPLRKRGAGGGKNLFLNYLSYVYNANKYIRKNKMEFDAILVYEISPITQAYPALYCKKKYGGKVLLWVQDLWPESVTAAGGINNKFALGILDRMVKRIYEKCDVLLVQSDGFRKSILSKGDLAQKIVFVPNWAEDLYLEKKMIETKSISEMMPDGFKVMFAGNIGAAQDIDCIVKAANETKDVPDIKYVIVGDGRARAKAEEQVKQMGLEKTVYFMGHHPMAQMPTFFSFADVMVVSLKDEYIFSLTIPAKTQSYLASGKPVVTMLNGEGSRIVEQAKCGLTAPSGDYKKFAENIKKLYHTDKAELEQMGKNGFEFYKKHFDKKMVIDNIIESMKQ